MAERTYKIVKKDREGLDAVRRPTAIEVAWAAGIYEGEGSCITNHSDQGYASFVVSVNQKDPELLYRMREMFGGSIKLCNRKFNGVVRPIYHWKICGDRARAFIFTVYPFLTARRKEQVEATPAGEFLEQAQDLLRFDSSLGFSQVYESIWTRINEYNAQQRGRALEHKKVREKEWRDSHANDEKWLEHRRVVRRQRKERQKIEKEQLKAVAVTKITKIA
jgi:hypothetical protein